MKKIEKTLATCKPREFVAQTNQIRKSAEKWLKDTNILNIRREKPDLPEDATEEQKTEAWQKKISENLSKMAEAIFDKYPNETLDLLAQICFIAPEHIDDYTMEQYFDALSDIIGNQAVLRFFTSLAKWGVRGI